MRPGVSSLLPVTFFPVVPTNPSRAIPRFAPMSAMDELDEARAEQMSSDQQHTPVDMAGGAHAASRQQRLKSSTGLALHFLRKG